MRKIAAVFVILAVLAGICPGFATGVSGTLDPEEAYSSAKALFDSGMVSLRSGDPAENGMAPEFFREALEKFTEISYYADSMYWQYYCAGMLSISEAADPQEQGYLSDAAEKIQEASQNFRLLAAVQFEDSEKIVTYCTARLYLLRGLKQSALDLFDELLGTLDSDRYYWRIINASPPMPTQAPVLPQILTGYAAHAADKLEAFAGPGAAYAGISILHIDKDEPLRICARDGYYCLAEKDTIFGIVRFWAIDVRIVQDEGNDRQLPEIAREGKSQILVQNAAVIYGPGKGYAGRGEILVKGTQVMAFGEEGAYTLIEYTGADGKPVRAWIATDCLSP